MIMIPMPSRRGLAFLHRWAALVFAPLFLLILLSGAFLACKPIWEAWQADRPLPGLAPQAWVRALETLDPQGRIASASLSSDGQRLILQGRGGASPQSYDSVSLVPVPNQDRDWFGLAKDLHKTLLLQADFLVEVATYAMTAILALGLLLGWPRLKARLGQWGLMDWHQGLGWLLAPLALLTPVTAILMILHIGTGAPGGPGKTPLKGEGRGKPPVMALAQAVRLADGAENLDNIRQIRRFRQGTVLIVAQDRTGQLQRLMVDGKGQVRPLTAKPGLVKQLHEGTWAGPWSGLLNLLAALLLSALLITGLWIWWVRRGGFRFRNRREHKGATLLVAYASQTGTAARYGEATARMLAQAGVSVTWAALDGLRPQDMVSHPHCLLLVSSTGQGEVPEAGQKFLARLGGESLTGLRFSLLALGDRRYPCFCGGGATFREELLARGAEEFLPWRKVDGDPAAPWRQWLAELAPLLGLPPETLGERLGKDGLPS